MTLNRLQANVSLKPFNTFQVDCIAEYYLPFDSVQALRDGLSEYEALSADIQRQPFILGGGSNILLGERIEGLTVHPVGVAIETLKVGASDEDFVLVKAQAGLEWDQFVRYTVTQGWTGIEALTLIPGNVGASVVQNIGAYGAEASETVYSVTCFNLNTKEIEELSAEQCQFGYRLSIFKQRPELLVLEVVCRLKRVGVVHRYLPSLSDAVRLAKLAWQSIRIGRATGFKPKMNFNKVREILALRTVPVSLKRRLVKFIRTKTMPDPKVVANVGCFFKSPIISKAEYAALAEAIPGVGTYAHDEQWLKVSAGDLIKHCALNGHEKGNVKVEHNRPLIIISNGDASGGEIKSFADEIQRTVLAKTNIAIEPEVVILAD